MHDNRFTIAGDHVHDGRLERFTALRSDRREEEGRVSRRTQPPHRASMALDARATWRLEPRGSIRSDERSDVRAGRAERALGW